ncbi:MAG: arginine--tRNA ligase [Desulfovibrio sp.]
MKAKVYLEELLSTLVADKGWEWPEKAVLEPPKDKKNSDFGDFSANIAMMLAKQAKKAPRMIAEELVVDIMAKDTAGVLEKVEVAGPGFLNFFFKPSFWHEVLTTILKAGEEFGTTDLGNGKKVQVEYVSANPTGPLHIGHGRGAALGDALARILRKTGHEVETEYYVNDAGRQMKVLGNSIWVRLQQAEGRDIPDPEELYKGEYIKDIAAEVLAKNADILEKDDAAAQDICREYGMNRILDGIKEDLELFDVEHQVWFSERSLVEDNKIEETFDFLKEKGLAYEDGGALWFKSTDFGDDKDRVLRKSSGDLTYFASDIAYHDNKFKRGFDLVVDIWGADHHGYVARMQAACEALGKKGGLHCILVQLVNLLRGGEQIAMSTRAGKFETLKDVIEEVGSDAARYIFLSRRSDSHLDFDLELVKQQTMDNPVYYVQYAHARICSVLAKAQEEKNLVPAAATAEAMAHLTTDEDLALLKHMDQYTDILNSAAKGLSPHFVTYFLQELAAGLHRYYSKHHILSTDEDLCQARLLLLSSVAMVIRNGLNLLGVGAPEKM